MLCFERRGRKLIAYIEGELDHDSTAIMRAEIDNQLYDRSLTELIIDMAGVSFMDSSGIGIVLGRYRRMQERDGRLYLSGLGGSAEKILRMAGVLGLVERK